MKKVACVTGADHGLGLELVRQFLKEQYVVFAGQFLTGENQLKGLKKDFGDQLHVIELDISKDESVKAAKAYIDTQTEYLDVLINNAAVLGDTDKTIHDCLDMVEIQKVINVNTLGTLRMTNVLMPYLLKSDQKLVINISSEAGSIEDSDRIGWFGYCMSKAAINMQSKLIDNDIKKQGGRVLAIHPGHLRTYMSGSIDQSAPTQPEEAAERIFRICEHKEKYIESIYIDTFGNPMNW